MAVISIFLTAVIQFLILLNPSDADRAPCGFKKCSCVDERPNSTLSERVIKSRTLYNCLHEFVRAAKCSTREKKNLLQCEWGGMNALFETTEGEKKVNILEKSKKTKSRKKRASGPKFGRLPKLQGPSKVPCKKKEMWAKDKDTLFDYACGTFEKIKYDKPTCVCDSGCRDKDGKCVETDDGIDHKEPAETKSAKTTETKPVDSKNDQCGANEVWASDVHEVYCSKQFVERRPGTSGCQCRDEFARDVRTWKCVNWQQKCQRDEGAQCPGDILALKLKDGGTEKTCSGSQNEVSSWSCRCTEDMRRNETTGLCVHKDDCGQIKGNAKDCPENEVWSEKISEVFCTNNGESNPFVARSPDRPGCQCEDYFARDVSTWKCVDWKKKCQKNAELDCPGDILASKVSASGTELSCKGTSIKVNRGQCRCSGVMRRDEVSRKCVHINDCSTSEEKNGDCPDDKGTEFSEEDLLFEKSCEGLEFELIGPMCFCNSENGMRRNGVSGECIHVDDCPESKERRKPAKCQGPNESLQDGIDRIRECSCEFGQMVTSTKGDEDFTGCFCNGYRDPGTRQCFSSRTECPNGQKPDVFKCPETSSPVCCM